MPAPMIWSMNVHSTEEEAVSSSNYNGEHRPNSIEFRYHKVKKCKHPGLFQFKIHLQLGGYEGIWETLQRNVYNHQKSWTFVQAQDFKKSKSQF